MHFFVFVQSKSAILTKACEYVKELQVQTQEFEDRLRILESDRQQLQLLRQEYAQLKQENEALRTHLQQNGYGVEDGQDDSSLWFKQITTVWFHVVTSMEPVSPSCSSHSFAVDSSLVSKCIHLPQDASYLVKSLRVCKQMIYNKQIDLVLIIQMMFDWQMPSVQGVPFYAVSWALLTLLYLILVSLLYRSVCWDLIPHPDNHEIH